MLFPGQKTTLALERTEQYSISALRMVGQLFERMMSLASPERRARRVDLYPSTYLPLLMTRPNLLLMFYVPTFLAIYIKILLNKYIHLLNIPTPPPRINSADIEANTGNGKTTIVAYNKQLQEYIWQFYDIYIRYGRLSMNFNIFSQQFHNMFKIKSTQSKIKATTAKITKIQQLIICAMDEIKHLSRQNKSTSSSPTKRRSDESSQSQSISQVLTHMKKGYLFTKHSLNTSQPHPKFIYLSYDSKYLCWKSPQKDDQKKIEIQSCEFYMKACRGVKNIDSCIVVLSTIRNLELQASNDIQAQIFRQELNRVIKYMQGMSHNYSYTK